MIFTKLNKTEKINSLLYEAKHLSKDIDIQNKQYEVLKYFLNNYIKECDYFPFTRIIKTEVGKVYTLIWDYDGKKLSIDQCDRLQSEIEYRTMKYKKITKTLIDELAKVYNPLWEQLIFVKDFSYLLENWMIYDSEDYIKMFHNKFYLKELTKPDTYEVY